MPTAQCHRTLRLAAIAIRAARAIETVTGDAGRTLALGLRRYDPTGANAPASDLYARLREAEHVLGPAHPALGRALRRYGHAIECLT